MKYTDDSSLPEISEERFQEIRQKSRPYTVLILKTGPNFRPAADRDAGMTALIMKHGKRNVAMMIAGLMPIVCPIADGSGITGIGIFDAGPDEVKRIYSADPAVAAGLFTFEVHPCRSFPGSALPAPEDSG